METKCDRCKNKGSLCIACMVPELTVSEMSHRCDSCFHHFGNCAGSDIIWGADFDPDAVGTDVDKVLECDGYQNRD